VSILFDPFKRDRLLDPSDHDRSYTQSGKSRSRVLRGSCARHRGSGQQRSPATILRAEARRTLATRFSPAGSEGLPVKCGLPILSAAIHQRATLGARNDRRSIRSFNGRISRQAWWRTAAGLDSISTPRERMRRRSSTPPDIGSGNLRAFVDSAIAIMAHVYEYETGTLGFLAPRATRRWRRSRIRHLHLQPWLQYIRLHHARHSPDIPEVEGGTYSRPSRYTTISRLSRRGKQGNPFASRDACARISPRDTDRLLRLLDERYMVS